MIVGGYHWWHARKNVEDARRGFVRGSVKLFVQGFWEDGEGAIFDCGISEVFSGRLLWSDFVLCGEWINIR